MNRDYIIIYPTKDWINKLNKYYANVEHIEAYKNHDCYIKLKDKKEQINSAITIKAIIKKDFFQKCKYGGLYSSRNNY